MKKTKTKVKTNSNSKSKSLYLPFAFIIGSNLLGSLPAIFTMPNIPTWYATLQKSPLNPPGWVFGPAWTILFSLMGYALYLVWSKRAQNTKLVHQALILFAIQFGLNMLWSYLFFGLRSPVYGLVEIILLWVAIYATITAFKPISKLAAWLMIPYLCWVTFASYLNLTVYLLN